MTSPTGQTQMEHAVVKAGLAKPMPRLQRVWESLKESGFPQNAQWVAAKFNTSRLVAATDLCMLVKKGMANPIKESKGRVSYEALGAKYGEPPKGKTYDKNAQVNWGDTFKEFEDTTLPQSFPPSPLTLGFNAEDYCSNLRLGEARQVFEYLSTLFK